LAKQHFSEAFASKAASQQDSGHAVIGPFGGWFISGEKTMVYGKYIYS